MTSPAPRKRRPPVRLIVQRTEWLTRHMIRVVLGGPGIAEFTDNDCTDHYVKLRFGTEEQPTVRTYTVRSFDPGAGELTIDFVYHGDEGVAGPWAAAAKPGDELSLMGPGGAYAPSPDADWHLLAGDESAIPAIAGALERVPEGAPVRVLVEVGGPEDEVKLDTPGDTRVTWLHRGDAAPGTTDLLVEAVRALEFPPGRAQAFVHGEAHAVMKQIRPHLINERGLTRDQLSISGYWRRGRTEEGFREWKAELAATESAG